MTVSATSRSGDLTVPELVHALKQRLCGISGNSIGYAALLDLWRICMTLTCTTSSNSSGLDLQEVRVIGDEN